MQVKGKDAPLVFHAHGYAEALAAGTGAHIEHGFAALCAECRDGYLRSLVLHEVKPVKFRELIQRHMI